MYSDLFDQLGRGGGGGRSGTAAEPVEEPPLLSVKAGKMILAAPPQADEAGVVVVFSLHRRHGARRDSPRVEGRGAAVAVVRSAQQDRAG